MLPYLDEKKIKKVLDQKTAFSLAKKVFELLAKKKVMMPPKIYLNLPGGSNDFRAMPAFVGEKDGGVCGMKWVSVFPENSRYKLPSVYATILLNSPKTGMPLAIFEGNHITAIRTAAAAAVATDLLANPGAKKLAIVGAGVQAEHQLRALADRLYFKTIGIWGFLPAEAEKFCHRFQREFSNLKPYQTIQECVADADVLVTCTPSRRPILKKAWVKSGAHINAIGADAKGKEELDPALLKAAKVVVDDWKQASHSGEINIPVSKGLFSKQDLYAELSEIVSGQKKGRVVQKEITIFDSTGLAALDVYFANHVYNFYHGGKKKA